MSWIEAPKYVPWTFSPASRFQLQGGFGVLNLSVNHSSYSVTSSYVTRSRLCMTDGGSYFTAVQLHFHFELVAEIDISP